MGEYDVEITNKKNGSKTKVTVRTNNTGNGVKTTSNATTSTNTVENEVETPLTTKNVYGTSTPTQKNVNSEKTKLMNKIKGLESTQNQDELETFRKKVSNATTMNQLTQLSTQINSMNTPPMNISTKPLTKGNQKKANVLTKMAEETNAAMSRQPTMATVTESSIPSETQGTKNKPVMATLANSTGGKRRLTKRRSTKRRTRTLRR